MYIYTKYYIPTNNIVISFLGKVAPIKISTRIQPTISPPKQVEIPNHFIIFFINATICMYIVYIITLPFPCPSDSERKMVGESIKVVHKILVHVF